MYVMFLLLLCGYTCLHVRIYNLRITFNTTELVMVGLAPAAVQEYIMLLSSSLTSVITRSVNPPVVELNTDL